MCCFSFVFLIFNFKIISAEQLNLFRIPEKHAAASYYNTTRRCTCQDLVLWHTIPLDNWLIHKYFLDKIEFWCKCQHYSSCHPFAIMFYFCVFVGVVNCLFFSLIRQMNTRPIRSPMHTHTQAHIILHHSKTHKIIFTTISSIPSHPISSKKLYDFCFALHCSGVQALIVIAWILSIIFSSFNKVLTFRCLCINGTFSNWDDTIVSSNL